MINEYIKGFKFKIKKALHYKNYSLDSSLTKYKDELNTLVKDGIVILPNFFSEEVINQINDEIKTTMFDLYENKYKGENKNYRMEEYGVYRLLEIDKISPASKQFFELDIVNELAKAFVSKDTISYQRMAEFKPSVGHMSVADNWHFDDWRHRFKAFLYLNDVTENEAPFVYLKGSHNPDMQWRERKEKEYYIYGKNQGSYGYYCPDEVDYIAKKYNYEKIVCNAKAGSIVMADTRGLHRGSVLRDNHRLVLVNFFDVRN
jgi:hypothetical protein